MRVAILKPTWIAGALAGLTLLFAAFAAQAQSDYRIRAGDTLQIEVLEDSSLNRSVLVLPDGTFNFPFAGSVRAGGRGVGEVRGALASALAPNFASTPNVVVSVASLAERPAPSGGVVYTPPTLDVYITGEIANAGRLEVKPGTTILQLIAEAGGLTPFAAETRIRLHRTDPMTNHTRVYLFSYNGKGKGRRISPATRLAPGDVVIVPARHLFE